MIETAILSLSALIEANIMYKTMNAFESNHETQSYQALCRQHGPVQDRLTRRSTGPGCGRIGREGIDWLVAGGWIVSEGGGMMGMGVHVL